MFCHCSVPYPTHRLHTRPPVIMPRPQPAGSDTTAHSQWHNTNSCSRSVGIGDVKATVCCCRSRGSDYPGGPCQQHYGNKPTTGTTCCAQVTTSAPPVSTTDSHDMMGQVAANCRQPERRFCVAIVLVCMLVVPLPLAPLHLMGHATRSVYVQMLLRQAAAAATTAAASCRSPGASSSPPAGTPGSSTSPACTPRTPAAPDPPQPPCSTSGTPELLANCPARWGSQRCCSNCVD
jgi:hypothetical protein